MVRLGISTYNTYDNPNLARIKHLNRIDQCLIAEDLYKRKDLNDQIFRTEPEKYNAITNKIIEKKLSVRQAENFVKIFKKGPKTGSKRVYDANIKNLEETISDKIGLNVKIKNNKKNKGTITFSYHDVDQLNKIIDIIKSYY